MRPDIAALAVGLVACAVGMLALWVVYGTVSWPLVGLLAPLSLVMIGVSTLLVARKRL